MRAADAAPASSAPVVAASVAGARRLRYDVIRNRLRQALQERRIVTGMVLLEGPVAEVFGTSRVPVRTAFELLFEEGLLQKFSGRGYLAAPRGSEVAPQRLPINEASLGQDGRDATIRIPPESERIYGQLEEAISTCVVFGHFRIDEVRATAHYEVNRAAVREALGRLVDRGLVEKSVYASWRAGPLTARAIAQDFELRLLLEPEALRSSGPLLDLQFLSALQGRLNDAASLDTESLLRIERQIHGDCLAHHANTKLLGVLGHCGMPLIVNQLFCRMFKQPPHPALVAEYLLVVEHLCAQRFAQATEALAAHLQAARKRTQQQLKALAVLPEPPLPDYLVRIA
jgi:DNA-binding GntR family transcriptional regulator